MFEFKLSENHSSMLLTALNGILKPGFEVGKPKSRLHSLLVRHDMYNTISSFDANSARDPRNIVETTKQDSRMVGPLKSS